jgi:succinate dehydrogenase/fumarate reductase cytochrome b subunit
MFGQTVPLLQVPGGPELLIVFVAFVVFGLGGLLVHAAAAYWVYKDADGRNMENPVLWAALVVLGSLVGLVVYLLVRE